MTGQETLRHVLALLTAQRADVYAALVQVEPGVAVAEAMVEPAGLGGAVVQVLDSSAPGLAVGAQPQLVLPSSSPQARDAGWCWSAPAGLSTHWLLLAGFRVGALWLWPLGRARRYLLVAAAQPEAMPAVPLQQHAVALLSRWLEAGAQSSHERESALRIETLVAHLETPMVLLEVAPMRAWINPAAQALLKLPAGASDVSQVGRALQAVLHDVGVAQGSSSLPTLAATGEPYRIQFHRHGKDWELVSQPLRGAGLTGRLWVFTDITLARQLERQAADLRRAESLSRLVGGVAHQFNNLLTVVIGNADMLLDYHAADSPAGACLDGILAAGDRGADIVRQLLVIARAAGGNRRRVDLRHELRTVAPVIRATCGSRVRWHDDVATFGQSLWVEVDPALLREAVLQIIANACDAMPDGGSLTLALAVTAAGASLANPQVVLRFQDTGVGMDADTLARAVEPFFTTREMAVARGLGLSVVEGFALQSGGTMALHSQPGAGTTVTLSLPLVAAPLAA